MYAIYADGALVYDSTLEDYNIGSGEINLELDKAGSFVFSLYPDHPYYDSFVKLKTVITVYKSGRIVFRGRILDDSADYWGLKTYTCEGELSFLQDSIVRPFNFSGTPAGLFQRFIELHNSQVDEFKRFKVGTVTVVDPNGYIARSNTAHESVLSNMTSRLLEDATGGHFLITHGDDGTEETPTIHYLADFTKVATQAIEFGSNLTDFTKTVKAEEIATAIIPLGATVDDGNSDTEDPRLTIAGVNGGVDYVYSPEAVERYGWIFKVVEWDDVTDAANLKAKAKAYLDSVTNQTVTLELTAVDLHLLDRSIESYNVCEYVPVYSKPHNFDGVLLCTKQSLNLLSPASDSVVLGHTFTTFTERSARQAAGLSNIQRWSGRLSKALQVSQKNTSELAQVCTRLDALYAAGYLTIYVNTLDAVGDIAALLQYYGSLTVNGQKITAGNMCIAVAAGAVKVEYTLAAALPTARTVTANGTTMGKVSTAGQSVSTTLTVEDGGTVVVNFTI
jgi:hypothetical protein